MDTLDIYPGKVGAFEYMAKDVPAQFTDQLPNQTYSDSLFEPSMYADPVFRGGLLGGLILLLIHFGICTFIMVRALFGGDNECQSLFSDDSIERHRMMIEDVDELQTRDRIGSSLALETLEEIKAENGELSIKDTIHLLHARLKEKGALQDPENGCGDTLSANVETQ